MCGACRWVAAAATCVRTEQVVLSSCATAAVTLTSHTHPWWIYCCICRPPAPWRAVQSSTGGCDIQPGSCIGHSRCAQHTLQTSARFDSAAAPDPTLPALLHPVRNLITGRILFLLVPASAIACLTDCADHGSQVGARAKGAAACGWRQQKQAVAADCGRRVPTARQVSKSLSALAVVWSRCVLLLGRSTLP